MPDADLMQTDIADIMEWRRRSWLARSREMRRAPTQGGQTLLLRAALT
jgi:hypothetical protein